MRERKSENFQSCTYGRGHAYTTIEISEWREGFCKCGAWHGAYGLEPYVEMYVAHTVEILREIRRVLRPDGVVFWNVGDSYAGKRLPRGEGRWGGGNVCDATLKPKDLCLIPARVALAAQADDWWVRSRIVWAKPNPMPESVTDRPTDAYEEILMLTKSAAYFWDAEAVKEKCTESTMTRVALAESRAPKGGYRNMRNVWQFPTQPYSGAHFAVFPEEIPRRAILASTSSKGACVKCGAPWKRILEVSELKGELPNYTTKYDKLSQQDGAARMALRRETLRAATGNHDDYFPEKRTLGWEPACKCGCEETRPCLVLDPFGGSGTTGRVATELNRRCVLLDLAYSSEAYAPLAAERLSEVQREMWA